MPKEVVGGVNMVDLDVYEDKIRPVPYGDFGVVELYKNPFGQ